MWLRGIWLLPTCSALLTIWFFIWELRPSNSFHRPVCEDKLLNHLVKMPGRDMVLANYQCSPLTPQEADGCHRWEDEDSNRQKNIPNSTRACTCPVQHMRGWNKIYKISKLGQVCIVITHSKARLVYFLFYKNKIFLFMNVFVMCMPDAKEDQKWVWYSLEPELQVVVGVGN